MKKYYVAPSADVIGNVKIGEESSIWYRAVVRADHDVICIGRNCNVQDGCILHTDEGFPVHIGDGATIGHGAIIHGCKIGENSLIGMGAIVLNGARIGKNCIIGAGALVTQGCIIPDGSLAFGNPAKVRRQLTAEEIEGNKESAVAYVAAARKAFGKAEL